MQAGTGKGCGHPWADPRDYTGARSLQAAEIKIWPVTAIFGKQKTNQEKKIRENKEEKATFLFITRFCASAQSSAGAGQSIPVAASVSSATAEGVPCWEILRKMLSRELHRSLQGE